MRVFHSDAVAAAILYGDSGAASAPATPPGVSVSGGGGSTAPASGSNPLPPPRAHIPAAADVARVLVIYTGGTIGMQNTPHHGYLPVRGFLTKTLRSFSRFHSPAAAAFAAAASPAANGPSTSTSNPIHTSSTLRVHATNNPHFGTENAAFDSEDSDHDASLSPGLGVDVYPSQDIPMQDIATQPIPNQPELTNKVNVPVMSLPEAQRASCAIREIVNGTPVCQVELPALLSPPSLYGKRIRYSILEYEPLLDSSNMTMADWVKISTDIEVNYTLYDAFIILHGTDTMAFTASALSFMLEDLGKTVILTGSQVPLAEVRNDAVDNLLGALTIAGHYTIPEVGLFFANKLFRGNRSSKMDATDFNAFDSPNLQPLVHVGINIDVNWNSVLRPNAIGRFLAHKYMVDNVASLRIFPGITASAVRGFLQPPIAGVVLETYGSGNAPNNRPDILEAFREASERGVVIVNCTQCKRGLVTDLYATGKALLTVGIVPGFDMTPECALTKLSYLLGKRYPPEVCRSLMRKNLRGELTIPVRRTMFSYKQGIQGLLQSVTSLFAKSIDNTATVASNSTTTIHGRKRVKRQLENSSSSTSNSVDTSGNSGADLESPSVDDSSTETSYSLHKRGGVGELPAIPDNELSGMENTLIPIMLSYAAGLGEVKTLESIVEEYPDFINATDYEGRTALHVAASEGRPMCVKFLLTNGAGVHIRDHQSRSALWGALANRHIQTANLMIEAGAHLTERENPDSMIRLIQCIRLNDFEHFHLWIKGGLDYAQPMEPDGATALHVACRMGLVSFVRFIVRETLVAATTLMAAKRSVLKQHGNKRSHSRASSVDSMRSVISQGRSSSNINSSSGLEVSDSNDVQSPNPKQKSSIKRNDARISRRLLRLRPYHSLEGTIDSSRTNSAGPLPSARDNLTSLGTNVLQAPTDNMTTSPQRIQTEIDELVAEPGTIDLGNPSEDDKVEDEIPSTNTEDENVLTAKNVFGITPLDEIRIGASAKGIDLSDEIRTAKESTGTRTQNESVKDSGVTTPNVDRQESNASVSIDSLMMEADSSLAASEVDHKICLAILNTGIQTLTQFRSLQPSLVDDRTRAALEMNRSSSSSSLEST